MVATLQDEDIVGYLQCGSCLEECGEDAEYPPYCIGIVRDGRHIVATCETHGVFKAFELAEPLHWHCADPTCTHGTRDHDDG